MPPTGKASDPIGPTHLADLAEPQPFATIHGSKRGPAEMSEDEPSNTAAASLLRDLEQRGMSADATCEPDRPLPAGSLREHQVDTIGPVRKAEEFWSPGDPLAIGLDEVAEGRVRGVDHRARPDAEAFSLEGCHRWLEVPGSGS